MHSDTPSRPATEPVSSALTDDGTAGSPGAAYVQQVNEATRRWVQHAVVGQNFCPFANAVLRKDRLRIAVSLATDERSLLDELRHELQRLIDTPETTLETTLLVCPEMLKDFLDFNDFLDRTDEVLQALGLEGVFQIASFHPDYQFAGTAPDDLDNATNQAPYPTLHLLRESSIERAVNAWGEDTDRIFEANIERLQTMGASGWLALRAHWQAHVDAARQLRSPQGCPHAGQNLSGQPPENPRHTDTPTD